LLPCQSRSKQHVIHNSDGAETSALVALLPKNMIPEAMGQRKQQQQRSRQRRFTTTAAQWWQRACPRVQASALKANSMQPTDRHFLFQGFNICHTSKLYQFDIDV